MPFREVSNKITTSNCPKCLFRYTHFCLHIIVIFLSKYNNVLDSKSLYVSSVTLSITRTIENTCTNNWNWKWRIFIRWLCWGQWTLLDLWSSWTSCIKELVPDCRLLLKMTKFHIIFYLKKNIDDVYIFYWKQ
jgi:hypothetical protein